MGDTNRTVAAHVERRCEMDGCSEAAAEQHLEKRQTDGKVVDRRVFCAQHGHWQHLRRQAQIGRRGETRATWWDVVSLLPAVAS
jgi:hypothetical protein